MYQIALWLVALSTTTLGMAKYGAFSIIGISLIGLTAYSVPSFVGLTFAYEQGGALLPASELVIAAHLVFWLVFMAVLLISPSSREVAPLNRVKYAEFAKAAMIIAAIIYAYIALQDSPLYFLGERQIGDSTRVAVPKIIWSWVVALGFIASLSARRYILSLVFAVMVMIVVVAGDRGIPVFIILSLLVLNFRDRRILKIIFNIRFIILTIILYITVFNAKALYNWVKFGGVFPDINPLSEANQIAMVKSFEPFVIHNTLEIVIGDGFSYSFTHLIKGVIGQVLFVPSVFGVRSSEWNVQFQDFLDVDLGYGVAYSYIGQAYSIGGIYCVIAFAFFYGLFIVYVNSLSSKMNGSSRILLIIFGVVCGAFIYRNSMENIIAIFRQILISYLLVRGVVVVINNMNVGSNKYESV